MTTNLFEEACRINYCSVARVFLHFYYFLTLYSTRRAYNDRDDDDHHSCPAQLCDV